MRLYQFVLLFSMALSSLWADAELGGSLYFFSLYWQNADFDNQTKDNDNSIYLHGDITAQAWIGKRAFGKVKIGTWGTFGFHPVLSQGFDGTPPSGAHIQEAYVELTHIMNTPFSLKAGKFNVMYGDGMVLHDGGEDGFSGLMVKLERAPLSVDIFDLRAIEGGGLDWMGTDFGGTVPKDMDIMGTYATIKGNRISFSLYAMLRTYEEERPIWFGLRTEGETLQRFSYSLEFSKMAGRTKEAATPYGGLGYMGSVEYSVDLLDLGLAAISFSGDDSTTRVNELYESAGNGPFVYGFYKMWPGFGPAHTLRTRYGWAALSPSFEEENEMMLNSRTLDLYIKAKRDALDLRLDLFFYQKNWVPQGKDGHVGKELGFLLAVNLGPGLDVGATVGYLMPGRYFGEDLDPMIGGYLFLVMTF